MKKVNRLMLLSLITLSLVGCGETASSTAPTSDTPLSEKTPEVTSSTKTSTTPLSSEVTSAPITSGDVVSSSLVEESTSSSVSIYDTTSWSRSIVDQMVKYLGGNIIPYLSFRKPTATFIDSTTRATSYLEINGLDEFDADQFTAFKTIYEDEGWTKSSATGTKAVYTKDDLHLKVTFGKDESGYWYLDAFYDEPFDETTAPTAWDSDLITEFTLDFGHDDIPYVYLGRKTPYYTFNSTSKTMYIYGWKYDSSILTTAKTTFTTAGWTVTEGTNSYGATIEASKSYPNGDKLTVTLAAVSSTSTSRYSMKIVETEDFNPTIVNSWDQDVLTEIAADFDNHDIPFIYLGTKHATVSYSDSSKKMTFTGGNWNDQIITLAKTSFETAGWIVSEGTGTYGKNITAVIDESDGCTLTATISTAYSASSKAYMYVSYEPKLVIPSTAKAWDSDTKQAIDLYLGGNTLPYIYLGDEDTTASFNNSYARLQITTANSGTYQAKLIDHAKDVLTADSWSVTEGTNTYGKTIEAEKTFANGDKLVVTFAASYSSSYAKPYLYVYYFEKFDPTIATTFNWHSDDDPNTDGDNSIGSSMEANFDNHTLPFIYLGSKYFNSSYNSSTNTMTVYGNAWNDQIIPLAETNLTTDNASKAKGDTDWIVSDDAIAATDTAEAVAATTMTASKTYADGCSITLTIKKPADPTSSILLRASTLTIVYKDAYGSKATDWEDSVKSTMQTNLGNYTVPYAYLHSDTPSCTKLTLSQTYYNTIGVYLVGGTWDDRIVTDAISTYTAAGWTITDAADRYNHPAFEAYKVNSDNSTLRVFIFKWSSSDTAKAYMGVYYDKATTLSSTATAWTDEQKTKMAEGSYTNYVPFFPFDTATITTSTSSGGYTQIKGTTSLKYNFNDFLNYKTTLESAGWTVTKLQICGTSTSQSSGAYSTILEAENTDSNGTYTKLNLTFSSSSRYLMKVYGYEKFAIPTSGSWSDDDKTVMEEKLNGFDLPYFYLGATSPKFTKHTANSTSSYVLTIQGSTWDDSIFTSAISVFSKDTTATWTTSYDYTKMNYVGKILNIQGEYTKTITTVDDETQTTTTTTETHYVTIKIYKNTESNGSRPMAEVYYC